jgi:hypothetical protein
MIRRISAVVLLCGLPACLCAREEYTRSFDKTVTLQPGQRIRVEHSLGNIDVHGHSSSRVVIHADIKVSASDANEAKSLADNIAILVDPSSSLLSIRTRYPERNSSFFGFRNTSYSVRYTITVPETAPLEIRNSFGAVDVSGMKSNCDVKTSHGNLNFRDSSGTQRVENSFASIQVTDNRGDITVENSNASVNVSDIRGAASIRNRFGSINVAGVSNAVAITNSNGSVNLADSGGPSAINNSFGSVTVSELHGGIAVNNTNGKIDANNIQGNTTLSGGFSEVRFSNVAGDVTVSNRNGAVNGRNARGNLSVQTSFGPVDIGDIGGNATITGSNGPVSVSNVKGSVTVQNSFGLVQAENTGALSVHNANSAVQASGVRGNASINTSFGAITLDNVSGAVSIGNQNGAVDVSLSGSICRPVEIKTSFSPVRVHLPPNPSYHVMANTSFGKIRSDIPLQVSGELTGGGGSSTVISGNIGGGQCPLKISDNNGDVQILRQ